MRQCDAQSEKPRCCHVSFQCSDKQWCNCLFYRTDRSCSDTTTSNITRKDTAAGEPLCLQELASLASSFCFEPRRREEQRKPQQQLHLKMQEKSLTSALFCSSPVSCQNHIHECKGTSFFFFSFSIFFPPPRCCLILAASQSATHLLAPRCSQFTVTH